ncbi:MAG: type III-B CRISPR-associated protein Cas10/Cmr2 [Fervidicoccaceae archaeon]
MAGISYRQLALLKINVLLHDPLNKSFLIEKLGSEFGEKHVDEAKKFLQRVLSETSLARVGLDQTLEKIVSESDSIASAFDRWVLRSSSWPKNSYVYYKRLHNVFDPRVHVELGKAPSDSDVNRIAEKLQRILAYVDKLVRSLPEDELKRVFPEKELLLYNALYTLLEPLWYSEGLSPSLADTRTPTHTAFDHLYASASVSNMLLNRNSEIDGFYVIVDFPGIQRFVGAGRKAGDVWASSWLLSNLVWSVNEYFMNTYGYDVVISPTPRMNPYTLRTLLSRLLGLGDQGYMLITDLDEIVKEAPVKVDQEVVREILCTFEKLYSDVDCKSGAGATYVRRLWLQPLIPATTSLLIPRVEINGGQPLSTEDKVAEKVNELFVNAWKNIVNFVESKLTSRSEVLHQIMGGLVKSVRSVLDTPPQGVNVVVVRIADVYRATRDCIVNRNSDICEELGFKNIDLESLHKSGVDLESLAKSLLWYILLTRSTTLARTSKYGRFYSHLPRPFWAYDGGQLKPVDSKLERFSEGWIPCSLCGQEPAYIALRKSTVGPSQITFKKEDVDELLSLAGIRSREGIEDLLTYVFKPGEALGPYCLLKRALYISLRDHLEVLSTDDVALSAISELLSNLEWYSKLKEKAKSMKLSAEDVEYLFTPPPRVRKDPLKPFKDIYALAEVLRVNYEDFVKKVTELLVETCRESGVKPEDLLDKISSATGVPANSALQGLLRDIAKNGEVNLNNLCEFLSLRTQYAIVKGDADNVGKIMRGELFCEIEKYKSMVDSIKTSSTAVGSHNVYEALEEGYKKAEDVLKALGLKSVPLSPAVHQAISLSLMLTAVFDYRIVREGKGVLIYSGGDDVLALLPVETAISTAVKLREEFYSNGFKMIKGVPVASAIPTGRSFSVRFANIMDVMSTEISNAIEYLENKAKKAEWRITGASTHGKEYNFKKDTLLVTSSRSSAGALFPLRISVEPVQSDPVRSTLDLVRGTPLLLLTVLSRNLPEDYRKFVKEAEAYMDPDSLYNIFKYVLKRNLKPLKSASSKESISKLRETFANLKDLSLQVEDEKSTGIQEYVKFVSIVRVIM